MNDKPKYISKQLKTQLAPCTQKKFDEYIKRTSDKPANVIRNAVVDFLNKQEKIK